jgi:hypothetical protein
MMDVKFLNKYNEVALDNFVAVVKQNILFQAQLATLTEQVQRIPDLEKQVAEIDELKEKMDYLKEDNLTLAKELNSKISFIEEASKTDADRFRLQTAVNNQMRENESLKDITISLQNKLKEQTEYIVKLEDMLPKTAKKKLGILNTDLQEQEKTEELSQEEGEKFDDVKLNNMSTGGTF